MGNSVPHPRDRTIRPVTTPGERPSQARFWERRLHVASNRVGDRDTHAHGLPVGDVAVSGVLMAGEAAMAVG
jgi:hypothetical protein